MSISVERDGGVLLLRIDRPAKANAIDADVGAALCRGFAEASSEPGIAALVLTGTGSRVFSAGADLKAGADLPPLARAQRLGATLSALLDTVLGFPKPFVAALNGAAIGAGAMLALLADAAVAALEGGARRQASAPLRRCRRTGLAPDGWLSGMARIRSERPSDRVLDRPPAAHAGVEGASTLLRHYSAA